MRSAIPLVGVALLLAACGGATHNVAPPKTSYVAYVKPGTIRSPHFRKDMDANPANLASAVVTHAFGLLPRYIDDATRRLLPYDMFRAFEPGHTITRTVHVTTPHVQLILDTVVTSGYTLPDARASSRAYSVSVTLDHRLVPRIGSYWIYYRNNGPQICRIYFPGDLGSLYMAAHSLVVQPLSAGVHRIRATVVERTPGSVSARYVTTYVLHVLARGPTKAERESAPDDDAPKPPSQIPLVLAESKP